MAERFYGLDVGENLKNVTEGSSSTATLDVEVRVDLAGISGQQGKARVLRALRHIEAYIVKHFNDVA